MTNRPYEISLTYQQQINDACRSLPRTITHLVMYLVFNDGSLFMLSNAYAQLKTHYEQPLFHHHETMIPNDEPCDRCSTLSTQLATESLLHPIAIMPRRHPEGTFIFVALSDQTPITKRIPERTLTALEIFCCSFVDQLLPVIRHHNPRYQHAFLLTNTKLRHAVIQQGYVELLPITTRQRECLRLAAQGQTVKQIAQTLQISPLTVDKYLKHLRQILQCDTLIEAVVEGIHRGLIGNVSYLPRSKRPASRMSQTMVAYANVG